MQIELLWTDIEDEEFWREFNARTFYDENKEKDSFLSMTTKFVSEDTIAPIISFTKFSISK